MKRLFPLITCLLIAGSSVLFSGCDNNDCSGMIWDFTNYDVCFIVKNSEGKNLLDPSVEGNILDNDIKVVYKDKTYLLNEDKNGTRANPPVWEGLRTGTYYEDDTMMLMFGEFSPTADYHGETFTVNWGDGTSDVVKFDLYITYKKCDPTVHRKIWLNGEQQTVNSFTLEITK